MVGLWIALGVLGYLLGAIIFLRFMWVKEWKEEGEKPDWEGEWQIASMFAAVWPVFVPIYLFCVGIKWLITRPVKLPPEPPKKDFVVKDEVKDWVG